MKLVSNQHVRCAGIFLIAMSLLGCSAEEQHSIAGWWQGESLVDSWPETSNLAAELNSSLGSVRQAAVADFDGNGGLDLVLGGRTESDSSTGSVEFFVVTADDAPRRCLNVPIFSNAPEDEPDSPPWGLSDLSFADYDGDGDPDLFVALNGEPDQVWENVSGNGLACNDHSFELSTNVLPEGLPLNTTAVAWADIDSPPDGRLDLAIGVWDEQSYLLHNLGNSYAGDRRFEVDVSISAPDTQQVRDLAWGVYSRDDESRSLQLAMATDGGTWLFSPESNSSRPLGPETAAQRVAWGNLNRDQHQDLMVAESNQLVIYSGGDGGGLDPDSPELVFANESYAWPASSTRHPVGLGLADHNQDGRLDVAVAFRAAPPVLLDDWGMIELDEDWEGSAPGSGLAQVTSSFWIDPQQRGTPELIFTLNSEQLLVAFDNEGDGPIRVDTDFAGEPLTASHEQYSAAVADYDKDGDLDVAVASYGCATNYCNVLYRNTLGDEGAEHIFEIAQDLGEGSFRALAWGDVDGDGDLDLAVGADAPSSGAANLVFINTGLDGDYGLVEDVSRNVNLASYPDHTRSVAWGDIDGDGDLDLAVGNHNETWSWSDLNSWDRTRSRIWENDEGSFTQLWQEPSHPVESTVMPAYTNEVAWGDFNNDGLLDLALANGAWPGSTLDPEHSGIFSNGSITGELTNQLLSIGPAGRAYSVAPGDANADGTLDLAIGRWGAPNSLFFYDHETQSWEAQDREFGVSTANETSSLVWGDYDLDGLLDLAESTWAGTNQLYVSKFNQDPNTDDSAAALDMKETELRSAAHQVLSDPSNTKKSVFLDYDNDGDLDILMIHNEGDNELFENHRRSPENILPNSPGYGLVGRPTLQPVLDAEVVGTCVTTEQQGGGGPIVFAGPGTTRIAEACFIKRSAHNSRVLVPIKLFDAQSDPLSVRLEYSAHGGGLWQKATTEGYLERLEASPLGVDHEINWLVGVDSLHSDRVRLRVVVDRSPGYAITEPIISGRQVTVSESFRVHSSCPMGAGVGHIVLDHDGDGDGYPCLTDCNDSGPDIFPGSDEEFNNDVDEDCDGFVRHCLLDRDGDGFADNSTDEAGNPLLIGSIDDSCDGLNETLCGPDGAADALLWAPGEDEACGIGHDCDDYNPEVRPGTPEVPNDGINNDCDPSTPDDTTGDDDDTTGDDDDTTGDDDDTPDPDDLLFVQPLGCEIGCSATTRSTPESYLFSVLLLTGLLVRRRRRDSTRVRGSGPREATAPIVVNLLIMGSLALLPCTTAMADDSEAAPEDTSTAPPEEDAEAERALAQAAEVAIEALAIHDEHCARMAGDDRLEKTDALVAVAPVWKKVTESYQNTGASYLLYWSGVLALCLGQGDNASDDLIAFLAQEGENSEFIGLLRDARRRLRLLGRGKTTNRAIPRTPKTKKAKKPSRNSEKSAARRARWGPPFMVAGGLGGQAILSPGDSDAHQFGYLSFAVDVSLRLLGPLRLEAGIRPALSGPARNEVGESNNFHSVLWTAGMGLVLQFETRVRPRIGLSVQLAPNPHGDVGERALVGGCLIAGLDIPLGRSPLSLRLGGEWGGLSGGFILARGLAELAFSP